METGQRIFNGKRCSCQYRIAFPGTIQSIPSFVFLSASSRLSKHLPRYLSAYLLDELPQLAGSSICIYPTSSLSLVISFFFAPTTIRSRRNLSNMHMSKALVLALVGSINAAADFDLTCGNIVAKGTTLTADCGGPTTKLDLNQCLTVKDDGTVECGKGGLVGR